MTLSKILKLFSRKKEVKIYTYNLADLNQRIESQFTKNFEDVHQKLGIIRAEILEEKLKTEDNLQNLLVAEMKVKGIPEKAKHIVEGNRKTYLQKVRLFMQGIDLPLKLEEIPHFCDLFNEKLNSFSTNTTRNYTILKDIIGEEAAIIASNLSNFDNLIKRSKKVVEGSVIEQRNDLYSDLKTFQQKVSLFATSCKGIEKINKELKKDILNTTEIKNSIEKLMKETKYVNYLELINDKKSLENKIKHLENHFFQSFSVIEVALKKYERVTLDNIQIKSYLENPFQTLLKDQEFKIVKILRKLKELIIKGKIEFKDKKKNKILDRLERLDITYFKEIINNYNILDSNLKPLILKIGKMSFIEDLKGLNQYLEETKNSINDKNQLVDRMQKEIDKIDLKILQNNLEKKSSEILGVTIKISL